MAVNVGPRQLAKWRASCLRDLQNQQLQTKTKVQMEVAEALKKQTWWDWATIRRGVVEAAVLDKIMEAQNDQTLFSEDEAKFMTSIMQVSLVKGSLQMIYVYMKAAFYRL